MNRTLNLTVFFIFFIFCLVLFANLTKNNEKIVKITKISKYSVSQILYGTGKQIKIKRIMMRNIFILLCMTAFFTFSSESQNDSLKSRAELCSYEETSLYKDIIRFLNYCKERSSEIKTETILTSAEGKEIPLVKLCGNKSKGKIKTKILIVSGVHSGEVDGKEASFVLIREILFGRLNYFLYNCDVFIIPTLNVDGNDKIDRYNRLSQNGPPGGVGLSDFPNGMNINRDYSKHEIPETEALIRNVINQYDPHIIIDCHTTNGSYHAYALTYAPPLNPNTNKRITGFLKNELFPFLTRDLFEKYKYRTQYYGNFRDDKKPEMGWETFNYRPRYSNNYFGLINRIGILSEGYSYLELKKRIDVTFKFVTGIIDYAARNGEKIRSIIEEADRDNIKRLKSRNNDSIAVTCELYEEKMPIEIYIGAVDSIKDAFNKGYTFKMKEDYEKLIYAKDFTNFRSSLSIKMPYGYLIPKQFKNVISNLKTHGIRIFTIKEHAKSDVEVFLIDSLHRSKSKFQAHYPLSIYGKYEKRSITLNKGDYFIPMDQVKSNLIPQLLEPLCQDGYVYWNFFDEYFELYSKENNIQYPVVRILSPVGTKTINFK